MWNTSAVEPIADMPTGTMGFTCSWAFDGDGLHTDYPAFHSEGGAAEMSVWANGDGTFTINETLIVEAK